MSNFPVQIEIVRWHLRTLSVAKAQNIDSALFIIVKIPAWKLPNLCPITSLAPTWKVIIWLQLILVQ